MVIIMPNGPTINVRNMKEETYAAFRQMKRRPWLKKQGNTWPELFDKLADLEHHHRIIWEPTEAILIQGEKYTLFNEIREDLKLNWPELEGRIIKLLELEVVKQVGKCRKYQKVSKKKD
jgi:hypothetical protein